MAIPASALPPVPDPRALLRRALERLAWAGLAVHAAFLTVSKAGTQIGLAVALGALVALRLAGRRGVWSRSPLDVPVLLLAGAAMLSVPLAWATGSPPRDVDAALFWKMLAAPVVVLSAIELGDPGEDREAARRRALRLAFVWIAVAILPAVVAWIQTRTGLDPLHALGLRERARRAPAAWAPGTFSAMGFFTWYPRFGHAMTPVATLAAALALLAPLSRRARVLLGLAAAAAASAVVVTWSRSAWAGLALAAIVLAVLAGARVRRVAVPLVVVVALAVGLASPGLRARLVRLGTPEATSDRAVVWRVCAEMVRERPLTGVGFGALGWRSQPYYERLAPDYPVRAWCHDSFFSAWAEGGPLLAGALAAWWLLLVRALLRLRRGADALGRAATAGALAGLAALFVNALVHDLFWSTEPVYAVAFLLAAAVALARPRPLVAGAP